MGDKPKFLYRPHEYGAWFARLGRKLKAIKRAGIEDWGVKERYMEQRERLKKLNVATRHRKWQKIYQSTHDAEYKKALHIGKSEQQAFKYARKWAENAVLDEFPKIGDRRTVRDAMKRLEDERF